MHYCKHIIKLICIYIAHKYSLHMHTHKRACQVIKVLNKNRTVGEESFLSLCLTFPSPSHTHKHKTNSAFFLYCKRCHVEITSDPTCLTDKCITPQTLHFPLSYEHRSFIRRLLVISCLLCTQTPGGRDRAARKPPLAARTDVDSFTACDWNIAVSHGTLCVKGASI